MALHIFVDGEKHTAAHHNDSFAVKADKTIALTFASGTYEGIGAQSQEIDTGLTELKSLRIEGGYIVGIDTIRYSIQVWDGCDFGAVPVFYIKYRTEYPTSSANYIGYYPLGTFGVLGFNGGKFNLHADSKFNQSHVTYYWMATGYIL